jgi:hypothetical protein
LAAAGVSDRAEPWEAWLQLRAAEGNRTTVIDLYELVAAPQGLAAQPARGPDGGTAASGGLLAAGAAP